MQFEIRAKLGPDTVAVVLRDIARMEELEKLSNRFSPVGGAMIYLTFLFLDFLL